MKKLLFILSMVASVFMSMNAEAQCTRTSAFGSGTASATCGASVTFTTCNYATEYATISGVVAGRTYRVNSSIATDWITVRHTTAAGTVVSFAVQGTNWVAPVSGTYYAHISTNSTCGTSTACRATSVTTVSGCTGPVTCTNTSSFGSATINTSGSLVTISTCSYAGEYSTISGAVAGQTLRFTSSIATDYITVRSGSAGGPIVAQGTTPLQFANTFTGTLYAHWNTNSSCGTQSTCRTTTVQCTSCTAPPAVGNDNCSGATALTCGGTATVNTTAATTDVAGSNFCGTSITTPGVWYSIAGNGQNMTVSTVGLTSTDTKIMVFSGSCAGLTCVGGNDDSGGLQSSVSWLSASGTTYYVLAAAFSGTASFPMSLTCSTPVADPCSSITSVSCGTASSYSLTGTTGAWNNFGGPWTTAGDEQVFSFTPTLTGPHSISVTSSEGYVDLFYKANSCAGSTGWTYVDDIIVSASNSVTLTAGVTYYFLLDDENTTATTGSLTITCPTPAPNPCASVTNIASCGVSQNVDITAGDGIWSSFGGPYTTPGRENIFTYTPTVTGSYPITVTNNGSGWIDLFVKTTASGCNNSGWTYIDDVAGTATNNVTLTAGTTYYFLLDDEDNSGSTGSITIGCPCIGQPVDGTYTYTGSFSISGNTTGACDNSALRAGDDLIYAVTIGCAGDYTFSTCGASWDTYLYLTTAAAGGGTIVASNDDNCGLQSSMTAALTAGTYYVVVEGFSSSSSGAFTLSVSGTGSAPSITGSAANATCFGASNGSITATVNGNGNTATATLNGSSFNGSASGLAAGTYTLSASNCWGTSTQTFTVGQPAQLTASVSSNVPNSEVCVGGGMTLTGTIGGDQVVTYYWEFDDGLLGYTPVTSEATVVAPAVVTLPVSDMTSSGTYQLVVSSNAICSASSTISVSVLEDPTLSVSSSNVTCNGLGNGSASVELSGGVEGNSYSYNWNNGGANSISTSTELSDLGPGTYSVTAEGAYGCDASASVEITQPETLVASSTSGAIACFGGSTTVEVTAVGGTEAYTGTGTFTVTAGDYSYTVTDANGCSSTTSITVTEPTLLTANAAVSDAINCNGENGEITVFAAGGTPAYTGTGAYEVSAGDYSYTVTDANGCTASVDISISEPTVLVASSSVTDAINCNGETGVITVTATGGTPGYTGTGGFSVSAGTYSYDVTDANGCLASTSTTITEPEVLTVNAGGDETVFYGYGPMECADLSASIDGGTPDYTTVWTSNVSGGGVGTDVTVCPQTNEVYTVTVTDANGCTASDDLSICVVNVECQAGNSDNIKVEMCQIPPGNPNNAHTICVNENAVPAHLAIGCTLGACGELDNCNYLSGMAVQGAAAQKLEAMNPTLALTAYPNPTLTATTVSVTPVDKGEYTIVLTDMTGRVIANIYNGFISDYENRTFEVDMTTLTGGVYVVNVIGGNGIMDNLKIVKE